MHTRYDVQFGAAAVRDFGIDESLRDHSDHLAAGGQGGIRHHAHQADRAAAIDQAQAALGHRLASHRAEAEAFAVQGNLVAALEQIEIGLKAGDGNFYELSAAEARRREWKEALAATPSK
jgi:hypothetical protein